MKRSPELRILSVQHHSGLVTARRLRQAARGDEALPLAVTQFQQAWRDEVRPHFRAEEEIVLPALAQVLPADHPLIVRALTEHVALRRQVRMLASIAGEPQRTLAWEISQSLDDHIRFEERILFPAI